MTSVWSLSVDEVFEFEDSRTVLVGTVENGPEVIPPGLCELVIDDRVVAEVEIEGEMMPSRRMVESVGKRAISIRGHLGIPREDVRRARLRPVAAK